ncbi:MAG: hypothetical protein GY930_09780 [bacterium]|nr:hypothetical protein [bacterium]
MKFIPLTAFSLILCTWLPAAQTPGEFAQDGEPKVGDLLPRIVCAEDYEARVFAIGLKAPDGLTCDSTGRILVVEETAGRVTRIEKNGTHKIMASSLRSPEGICTGENGEFFVVEDCADGRLLRFSKEGKRTVLATGLNASEGVLYVDRTLYFTESTAQLIENKFAMRTRVSRMQRSDDGSNKFGPVEVLIKRRLPYSFSELASDGPGSLLLTNEVANSIMSAGLVRLNLSTKKLDVFALGLESPEGVCRAGAANLPLLVAEEYVSALEGGRISRIVRSNKEDDKDPEVSGDPAPKKATPLGRRTTLATGFETIEDVLVTPNKSIFVTEDATGMIIELRPKQGAKPK